MRMTHKDVPGRFPKQRRDLTLILESCNIPAKETP